MDKEFSEFISNVLEKTDIVSLISRYVRLDRKGNTHWACCPFHHEAQPSFAVNEAKQFFHCFGCKESGNAISFLMKIENIEFIDALKMLAEQAGMELPKRSGTFTERVDKKQREALYSLMRDAARHYHDNLSDARAKPHNEYLQMRKITPQLVKRFGLGASLGYQEMIDFLTAKGYTLEQMRMAGIAETKDGKPYDVFAKRLMYPIIDNMNRVIAFGGRTLEKDTHFAKYRNSSQTEIFDKSNVIYGINLLKKRKAVKPIEYVIMTEGYMDVIALHKAGFDTAVASMGTALTSRQARQIKLYSDLVYISYDGDTAGQKATLRGLDILRDTGLTVKVVRLPQGLDPDDLIKRGGQAEYQKLLDEAIPLTAYKIEVLKSKYDVKDPDQKAKFAIESSKVVAALDNPIEQEQYFKYVSEATGFSTEALRRQANVSVAEQAPPVGVQATRDDNSNGQGSAEYDGALKFYLASLAQSCDYVSFDMDLTDAMPDEFSQKLYKLCRDGYPRLNVSDIIAYFGESKALNELLDHKFIDGDGRDKFNDVQSKLRLRLLKKENARLTAKYAAEKNGDILDQLQKIGQEIAQLNKHGA